MKTDTAMRLHRLGRAPACLLAALLLSDAPAPSRAAGREAAGPRHADVIVYGSTPGGFSAAIAAAREGASVILLEPTDHVGGLNTGGLSHCDSNQMVRNTVIGLFHEWHVRVVKDYADRGLEKPYDPQVKDQATWTFEPQVAMRVTLAMLKEAGVTVLTGRYLKSVEADGPRIKALMTSRGRFTARVFVDGTYEGDLMATAGVDWTIGREGRAVYGESLAGKQYPKRKMNIDGFDAQGNLLPLVTTGDAGPEAAGDGHVMTYSFRLCLTENPDNRVPMPEPARYDPARFEVVRRALKAGVQAGFDLYPLPGGKLDGNNSIGGQFSLGLVGGGNDWHTADEAGRKAIWEAHKQYTLEFLHFLTTDPAVPAGTRAKYAKLGLCKDEFASCGHFSPALYVRESRRMKGLYVISQKDILDSPGKDDPIAVSSFPIDSHDCQRVALKGGSVINEGTIFPVRRKNSRQGYAYQVPYRSILPKPEQGDNLLVPVALSCTHVGISSLRIEGTWMLIGQSAGIAAAWAARHDVAVQAVPYPAFRERMLAQGQVLDLPDSSTSPAAAEQATGRYADHEELVAQTHTASLKLREETLRRTLAKGACWPPGIWGDNLWTLSALYRNERVDVANARLLKQAKDYIDRTLTNGLTAAPTPEQPGNAPWTFFSITDYVRTLCLFHAKSAHFPGRLKTETEAAMKEALWLWVRGESRVADAGLDDLFLLLGTENHDLNKRPNYYLVTALLKEDPDYKDRKLADGHTVSEHAAAYTTFFREWPRSRARSGLWVEVGSSTYQKYSWPALFNLHELAPDPVVRHRFGLLLDLAFIEEAQLSVQGRRGGGRSRADYDPNSFESYQNLLYACEGQPAGSSHSRVIETSRYQLPPAAILLRKRAFPAAAPFVIRNRVLGELEAPRPDDAGGGRLAADSALVNYVYRAPTYLLGSTLQNPALAMPDPATGSPTLKYAGISRQKRACGLLFDHSAVGTISQVHPVIEHTGGGRSQHSFWSVQQENVLLLQRIARHGKSTLGSYNTGKMGMRFEGADLQKVEEDGWIFASNGKAFVGVRFLDGGYQWDEKRVEANPANFTGAGDTTRILLQAGDAASHGSFDRFRAAVRAYPLTVTADKVDYRSGSQHMEISRYVASSPETFVLPLINGTPVDLRSASTHQSPYLKGELGGDCVTVTVGPVTQVLDFAGQSGAPASSRASRP